MDPASTSTDAPVQPASRKNSLTRGRASVWALVLLAAAALLFGARLGVPDLWAPDEPRYAAIAEELRSMRHGASGLALLHLNDTVYTQKPPFYFWLAALAGTPNDRVSEFAARLPSAVAGLLGIALTLWIARRLSFSRSVALLSGGVLATSFRYAFTARRAQLDVLLTALELIAIALFLWLDTGRSLKRPEAQTRLAVAGLHSALGAACLTKGPVGWLPLVVFGAFLAWEGRPGDLRRIVPAWALSLSVAPLLLWTLTAVVLAPDGFFEVAVLDNVFGRLFAGASHARPFYYYFYQLPLNFMPWGLGLPLAGLWFMRNPDGAREKTQTAEDRPTAAGSVRFLLCWIIVPLILFSLAAGKRPGYLLPIFPALSIVTAAGILSIPKLVDNQRRVRQLAITIAGVALLELGIACFVFPRLNETKSPRPIAAAISSRLAPDEAIGVYDLTPIEGGLGFYGDRPLASLPNAAAVAQFLDQRGRFLLMRDRHFESLAARFKLTARASFREDRRKLILAEIVR